MTFEAGATGYRQRGLLALSLECRTPKRPSPLPAASAYPEALSLASGLPIPQRAAAPIHYSAFYAAGLGVHLQGTQARYICVCTIPVVQAAALSCLRERCVQRLSCGSEK